MFDLSPYRRNMNNMRGFKEMNQIFNSMMEEFFTPESFPFMNMDGIKVDIKEKDEEYIVEAEIPGADKKDIKLELRDDILSISVERDEQINEERENYIRKERRSGKLQRSFYVDNIKEDEIKAKFEDGILYVRLPKDKSSQFKNNQIEIE